MHVTLQPSPGDEESFPKFNERVIKESSMYVVSVSAQGQMIHILLLRTIIYYSLIELWILMFVNYLIIYFNPN